jgi:hypothetical protein
VRDPAHLKAKKKAQLKVLKQRKLKTDMPNTLLETKVDGQDLSEEAGAARRSAASQTAPGRLVLLAGPLLLALVRVGGRA